MQNLPTTLISKPAVKTGLIAVIILIILLVGNYAANFIAQTRITAHMQSYLSAHNPEHFAYRRLAAKNGEITLYGISFDQYDFYTIERLTVFYNPFQFLRSGVIEKAHILRPSLTLEGKDILERSGISYRPLPVDLLEIENGEINFLSRIFGDVIVHYDANFKMQENGYFITANYKSAQPHIKISGSLQGEALPEQKSEIHLSIDGIEIDTADIALRRSNADLNLLVNPDNYLESEIQLQATAGNAHLYSYPWTSANFSFNGTLDSFIFAMGGKTPDDSGGEFTYSFSKNAEEKISSAGTIYAEDGAAFYRYIIRNNPDFLHPDDQPIMMAMDKVDMNFEIYPGQRKLIYYMPEKPEGIIRRREILFSR